MSSLDLPSVILLTRSIICRELVRDEAIQKCIDLILKMSDEAPQHN